MLACIAGRSVAGGIVLSTSHHHTTDERGGSVGEHVFAPVGRGKDGGGAVAKADHCPKCRRRGSIQLPRLRGIHAFGARASGRRPGPVRAPPYRNLIPFGAISPGRGIARTSSRDFPRRVPPAGAPSRPPLPG